jgi:hypothetical protein
MWRDPHEFEEFECLEFKIWLCLAVVAGRSTTMGV